MYLSQVAAWLDASGVEPSPTVAPLTDAQIYALDNATDHPLAIFRKPGQTCGCPACERYASTMPPAGF